MAQRVERSAFVLGSVVLISKRPQQQMERINRQGRFCLQNLPPPASAGATSWTAGGATLT